MRRIGGKLIWALLGLLIACIVLGAVKGRSILLAQSRTVTGATLRKDVEGYRKWWTVWPGTQPLHPGTEPHGALLTTYLNLRGKRSLWYRKESMLPGSTLLVENYDAGGQFVSITVMHKVEKYNPGAGDWFWAQYAPNGQIQAEGKIEECIGCHSQKAGNDYVFTAPLR